MHKCLLMLFVLLLNFAHSVWGAEKQDKENCVYFRTREGHLYIGQGGG